MATYAQLNDEIKKQAAQVSDSGALGGHLKDYNQAMTQLSQVKENLPVYDNRYDSALQSLFDELANYKAFSYDSRGDALYQSYKQSYTDAGKMAMQHTMGQAAALTGGYGSSYGQAVGQQQYNAYLQKLNEVLPETYNMAYQQYQDGRNALQEQYNRTGQLVENEYKKYQDSMDQYYRELDYWQNSADTAYNRYQQEEQLAYDRQQDEYAKQQDVYDRLADMIVTMGYVPDADELAAAGMSDSHYQAYLNYYNISNGGTAGGGRGRSNKKNGEDNDLYAQMLADQKAMIDKGKSVETINGSLSNNAVSNGLSIEETRKMMEELTNYAASKGKV